MALNKLNINWSILFKVVRQRTEGKTQEVEDSQSVGEGRKLNKMLPIPILKSIWFTRVRKAVA